MTVGLKLAGLQIGANPTATQNFVLSQGADGTIKLARGNDGATTQDVLTVDASGRATLPQGLTTMPAISTAQSMVRLNTQNGYGSSNTRIRRFTNVVTNQGSDITYADSATLGATFTINTNGVYSFSYSESLSAAGSFGLSLNTSAPTTNIQSIPVSEIIAIGLIAAANQYEAVSATMYLSSGSIVRPHTDATTSGTAVGQFIITRVS